MAKTVAFGLRNRQYDAECTNVQQQLIQPSEGDALERTNLSFTIRNIKPYDLKDSGLLAACFRVKDGGAQLTIETQLSGAAKTEADYNALFDVLAVDKGTRHDEDATHKLYLKNMSGPLADPEVFDGGRLRPRSGIKIKTISASPDQLDGDPRVDITLIAKGFDHWVGGFGWLISDFTIGFEPKNKVEAEEDGKEAEKKRKEKGNPDQGELIEGGVF